MAKFKTPAPKIEVDDDSPAKIGDK